MNEREAGNHVVASQKVKVDLHVHSACSDKPFSWFMKNLSAAECYTPVEEVYRRAMSRGMDLVTLTDHDVIDGALMLAEKYDNAFVSEEVSMRFPEDGCIVHGITLDITEKQHGEIQRLRTDIYDLVQYLDQENIVYFWCHPLSDVNHRLSERHLERCFLMFNAVEGRNGTRDTLQERRLQDVLEGLNEERLNEFAERHPHVPRINTNGRYALVGGSDDHGGLAIARAHTCFEGDATVAGLCNAIRERRTYPGGNNGSSETLVHNAFGVVAGAMKSKGHLGHGEGKDMSPGLLKTLHRSKSVISEHHDGADLKGLIETSHTETSEDELSRIVKSVSMAGWNHAFEALAGALGTGKLAEATDGVADLIKATLMDLPAILARKHHFRDARKASRFAAGLLEETEHMGAPRVAVIADAMDNANGLAIGLKRLHAAAEETGLPLFLVTAGADDDVPEEDGVLRVPSVYSASLPEYPDIKWHIPHLPTMMRLLMENQVELVQCSTPGPVGLVGLAAARLLGIPVVSQYHTDVPTYILHYTKDPTATAMATKLVSAFYKATDRVFVPSEDSRRTVEGLGVDSEKTRLIQRGIRLESFGPTHADRQALKDLVDPSGKLIVYVGRLAPEKNLRTLLQSFAILRDRRSDVQLLIVGDGPMRPELEAMGVEGVSFSGELHGRELSRAYASADLFCSLSESETFGNVVVEAQASALPVVIGDRGGMLEHMVDGETGLVVPSREPTAIASTLEALLGDDERRGRMAKRALEHASTYDLGRALHSTFAQYQQELSERVPLGVVREREQSAQLS